MTAHSLTPRTDEACKASPVFGDSSRGWEFARTLERENQALRANAERYQWLRDGESTDWHIERWIPGLRASGTWKAIKGAKLDSELDTARKALEPR